MPEQDARARAQAKLEDSEAQVRELSRQVMALERAKLELEARNRQLESSATQTKDCASAGTPGVGCPSCAVHGHSPLLQDCVGPGIVKDIGALLYGRYHQACCVPCIRLLITHACSKGCS